MAIIILMVFVVTLITACGLYLTNNSKRSEFYDFCNSGIIPAGYVENIR